VEGWIKLYRKLRNSVIWNLKEPFDKRSAWIDLLLSVNHADNFVFFSNEKILVKAGSFITSLRGLSEKWKWSITKVDNFLNTLNKEHMILVKKDTKKTVISVENWGFYQGGEFEEKTPKEQEKENEKDTEKTPKETNKNDNNDNNSIYNYVCSDEDKKIAKLRADKIREKMNKFKGDI